jgi:hypothetical protein
MTDPAMMDSVDQVGRRPYIVTLAAGPWVYVYSGYNRLRVLGRATDAELVMIGANFDTDVRFLQARHFHETYRRLCDAVGFDNVMLMAYPKAPRQCLRCRASLVDVMGVYVFVAGRAVLDEILLCVNHGSNGTNNLPTDEYLRLRSEFEAGDPTTTEATP